MDRSSTPAGDNRSGDTATMRRWYLLPWTDLAWSELQTLPCYQNVRGQGMSFYAQYVLSVVLMKVSRFAPTHRS